MLTAGLIYRAAFGCSALAIQLTVSVLMTNPHMRILVLSLVCSMLAIGAWILFAVRRWLDGFTEKPIDREKQRQAAALVAAVNRSHLRSVR